MSRKPPDLQVGSKPLGVYGDAVPLEIRVKVVKGGQQPSHDHPEGDRHRDEPEGGGLPRGRTRQLSHEGQKGTDHHG